MVKQLANNIFREFRSVGYYHIRVDIKAQVRRVIICGILGDCGQWRRGRSRATGGDLRGLLAWRQYYSDQWKRSLDRRAMPGDLFNIWTTCRRLPATSVLICKILYHAVALPKMTSVWRSPVSGDCWRSPSVVKWCLTLPGIADRLREKNVRVIWP